MRSLALFLLALSITAAHAAISPEQVEQIRGLIRERKFAEAESAANAFVAAQPKDAEAQALLGLARGAKGDVDGAVAACEKAVELAPANGDLYRQLGDAYALGVNKVGVFGKMSLAKKVLGAYEKAVELDPKNILSRLSLMTVYQQAPSMMGGGADKAYAQAAEIKKLDSIRGRTAYATLYTGEKKYNEAFAELEDILKAAPDNYPALFQLGRLAAISGERIDRGMEVLKKCLALTPPASSPGHDAAHWRMGNLWEKKGDKAAARAEYQASLKVTPTYPQAIEALKKLE
jgi:tetratricopeptide (TPR) repeat protein